VGEAAVRRVNKASRSSESATISRNASGVASGVGLGAGGAWGTGNAAAGAFISPSAAGVAGVDCLAGEATVSPATNARANGTPRRRPAGARD
jgi:hypothetical protein